MTKKKRKQFWEINWVDDAVDLYNKGFKKNYQRSWESLNRTGVDPTYRDPKTTPRSQWEPVTYAQKIERDKRRKEYEDIAWNILNFGSSVAFPSQGMGKGVKGALRVAGTYRARKRGNSGSYARQYNAPGVSNNKYGRSVRTSTSYRKKKW